MSKDLIVTVTEAGEGGQTRSYEVRASNVATGAAAAIKAHLGERLERVAMVSLVVSTRRAPRVRELPERERTETGPGPEAVVPTVRAR